jgi:outer membrane protein TolC
MVGAWRAALLAATATLSTLPPLAAQAPGPAPVARQQHDTLTLGLEDALTRATRSGQEVRIAETGIDAASSRLGAARAARLPQLSSSFAYTKTFASIFEGGGIELPDSLEFDPDPTGSLQDRVAYLEDRTPEAGLMGLGQLFSSMPFGQENVYVAGLTGSQVLYAGGRISAGIAMAEAGLAAAEEQLAEDRAQVELDVTRAYYRAVLSAELVDIAVAALEQAEDFLDEERLRFQAGRASELDVLRAEVDAANLRPSLIAARNGAELAELDLKRLVDVPMDQPLQLSTDLDPSAPEGTPWTPPPPDLVARTRPAVVALERVLAMREGQVQMARAAFKPTVALQMSYARQAFPEGVFGLDTDWRADWTGGVVLQLPIFSGGQRGADVQTARAEANAARFRLRQLEELVELEYRQALAERERAHSEIDARRRTVEVARRVHELTVLRYERGLATQLEVASARVGLLTARTNLVQALADERIAEATVERALGGRQAATRLPGGAPEERPGEAAGRGGGDDER